MDERKTEMKFTNVRVMYKLCSVLEIFYYLFFALVQLCTTMFATNRWRELCGKGRIRPIFIFHIFIYFIIESNLLI